MSTVAAEREATLRRLADTPWPLLIVGGGIVGTGALLDATSRGIGAACIEQEDLAVGTSSRSSRLIHGGLRYLERMEIRLVREALTERGRLLRLAPHLVTLEPFLFPLYGPPLLPRLFYGAGLTLYDLLGAAADGGRSRHLGRDATLADSPALRPERLRGAIRYHDGVEDDARLVIAVARTAIRRGATLATQVRATGLLTTADGRVAGIRAEDRATGRELEIRANAVLDATGVWMGRADAPLGGSRVPVVPSRGSHLIVPRERIAASGGITLRIPGKVLFLIPWPGAWIIGTTDEPDAGPPDHPTPTHREIRAILETVNRFLDVDLSERDVLGTYTGLRPLVGAPGAGGTVRVSREHRIGREENGLTRISGGKYTTYRLMAEQAVDAALGGGTRRSGTATLALVGALDPAGGEALVDRLVRATGLDRERCLALVARHGTEAPDVIALGSSLGLLRPLGATPHLEAEVAWAVREELAGSIEDILSRRMRLAMLLPDRGASIADRVDEIAGAELGWDPAGRAARISTYLAAARREHDLPRAEASR